MLEFALNTCVKTFLIEGEQKSFDILASNGYDTAFDEIVELIERGIVTSEFDTDFCKKLLAMHGSNPSIEAHILKLERKIKAMNDMDVRRAIKLQKPL